MSSLTDELSKLFALHQAGALTAEEFQEAKTSVIQSYNTNSKNLSNDTKESVNVDANNKEQAEQNQEKDKLAEINSNRESSLTQKSTLIADNTNNNNNSKSNYLVPAAADGDGDDDDLAELLSIESTYSSKTKREIEQYYSNVQVYDLLTHNTRLNSMTFEVALRHLERIVLNVLQNPHEMKYRQLRHRNKLLSRELWIVTGTLSFLHSIGFATIEQPTHTSESSSTTPNEVCYYLYDDQYNVETLSEAVSAIAFIRECDRAMRHRLYVVSTLSNDPMIAIRLERGKEAIVEATSIEDVISFFTAEFTVDDAQDSLRSSLTNLIRINKLLEYVLAHRTEINATNTSTSVSSKVNVELLDNNNNNNNNNNNDNNASDNEKNEEMKLIESVKLKLSNELVYQCIVQQRGALELLLHVAKGQLANITYPLTTAERCPCNDERMKETGDMETMSKDVHNTTSVLCENNSNAREEVFNEVYLVFPRVIIGMDERCNINEETNVVSKTVIEYTIDIVNRVKDAVERVREIRVQEERQRAIEAMREERQRAMLHSRPHTNRHKTISHQSQSNTPTKSKKESENVITSICENDSDSDTSSDSDNNRNNSGKESLSETKQKRIPIAEALAILLGKKRDL